MKIWASILAVTVLMTQARTWAMSSDTVKRACDEAANWLIDQHDVKTGTFGKGKNASMPGLTAVVINALCDHPRKYTENLGPFISEPVQFILKAQQQDGSFSGQETGRQTYNTALSLLALKATKNPKYQEAISKARQYLVACQAKDGGFAYAAGAANFGDLSNTWLAVCALRAGGEQDDSEAFKKALTFIRSCQDHPETNPAAAEAGSAGTGGAYYQPGKSEFGTIKTRNGKEAPKPYGSMTAAALESYIACGLKPSAAEVQAAMKWFKTEGGFAENSGGGPKGYFYFTMAFARAMTALGVSDWESKDGTKVDWAAALAGELLKKQNRQGFFLNADPQWMEDDPVLCTGYALNALNICYKELKKKK